MVTTLDIDDDVLQSARELAAGQHMTLGKILSDLARQALRSLRGDPVIRNGVPLLPSRPGATAVTLDMVNALHC